MRFHLFAVAVLITGSIAAMAQVSAHAPAVKPTSKASAPAAAAPSPTAFVPKPVARVNGTTLNDLDLTREMYSMFPYAKQHNGFPKKLEPEMRKGALEMIIFEELLYQEAKRRNLTVPAAQLAKAEAAFKKQFANETEYKQLLQVDANGSQKVMREKIRRSLLIDLMLKNEVTVKSKPTDAEVKAYYIKNPQQYVHGEMIHIQSISIIPPVGGSADVLKEAKRRADEAAKSAKATKDYREFGLLAEKLSDDDYRVNMGDHKDVPIEQMPPEIIKAAKAMKSGQVSDLIQLGSNYTVFRLVSHTPAGKTPFVEVQANIRKDLEQQKTEQIRSALNKRLQKSATIERL